MKTENAELAEELANIADNLIFGEDGSIRPFIWEISERGEWSLYNLVMQNQVWEIPSLRVENFEDFNPIAPSNLREEFQEIFEVLKSCIGDVEFYVVYYPDEIFCLFLGRTTDGYWIGVGSGFNFDQYASYVANFETPENLRITDDISPSQAALQVKSNLEQRGFSETKLPVWDAANRWDEKRCVFVVAQQKELLIEKLLTSVKFLVVQDFGEGINVLGSRFYASEDDPKRDYQELDRVLQSRLTNLRLYMVGLPSVAEFEIYIVGNTPSGDYGGVLVNVPLNP
jgi:Nuclease A inhibitor-like protein